LESIEKSFDYRHCLSWQGWEAVLGCPAGTLPSAGGETERIRAPICCFPYNVRIIEPTTTPKTRRIEVRLSDEERELDAAAASALGESLSDFFRRAAQARAQEVLADQRTIALNDVEATRFLEALERPDEGTVGRLEDLRRRA
jgi:uncharacterized protein (DUF1778 family)